MRVFISLLVCCLAIAVGKACHDVSGFSYPPPGGQLYDIYGVRFGAEGPNSAAFKLHVHGSFGKRECANFAKGELKPAKDGHITAYCKNYPVDGQYVSLETTKLNVCGEEMEVLAAYKPCPANSRRVGAECQCNDGYKLVGGVCSKASNTCGGHDYIYCHRRRKDCNHRDIRRQEGSPSLQQCQEACNKDCKCKSIQYNALKHCWLKRHACSAAELVYSSAGNDYVRIVRGQKCPR